MSDIELRKDPEVVEGQIVDAEVVDLPERPELPVPVAGALPAVWEAGLIERRPPPP